jgi:hypothetical protein
VITCAEAVTRLWEYVERTLPADQELQVDDHIAVCRQCCGEAEFAGELRGFLGTHAQERIAPDARTRLEGFLQRLDDDVSAEST